MGEGVLGGDICKLYSNHMKWSMSFLGILIRTSGMLSLNIFSQNKYQGKFLLDTSRSAQTIDGVRSGLYWKFDKQFKLLLNVNDEYRRLNQLGIWIRLNDDREANCVDRCYDDLRALGSAIVLWKIQSIPCDAVSI